ncbi:hypothetical protein ACFE04_024448 [Oxalis oulophora]
MANGLRIDSLDYRTELLSPPPPGEEPPLTSVPSWRLNMDRYQLPVETHTNPQFGLCHLMYSIMKQKRIAKYYKRQEVVLKGFNEVDSFTELGILPGTPSQDEMRKQIAKGERMAIYASNAANLIIFVAKVYASVESRSLAVIASTLDSLLDLLSGFILWFTDHAMRRPNEHSYPIGKNRMQPVGIIVFASVMATLGLQILFESGRELLVKTQPEKDAVKIRWMIGIMCAVTIALYTMGNWAKTVKENVWSLIGRSAPPEYLAKLTYLIWNHDEEIKHIDTVRAYTFGSQYFVEVDIVLPEDMTLAQAHDIGEALQEKLELLPEVERAFVHIDFDIVHQLEHKPKKPHVQ